MKFPPPSVTAPTLSSFEWQCEGLTIGGFTTYGILGVEGWDLAKIMSKNVQRNRDYGEILGLDVFAGRDVIIDMWVKSDGISLQDAELQIASAFQIMPDSETYLWGQLPNLPVMCAVGRCEKKPRKIDSDYANANISKPSITFHATDPRLYGQALQVELTLGGGASGGVTFTGSVPPASQSFGVAPSFTVTFGANSGTTTTIENEGNMEMRPYLIFNGPLTNPFFANETQSAMVTLQEPGGSGYTVLSGDQATIDLDTHLVQYWPGGIAANTPYAIQEWLTYGSQWWNLPGGVAQTIQFGSADATNVGGTGFVWYAPAWEL